MTSLDKNGALVRLAESDRAALGRIAFDLQDGPQKVFSAVWELEAKVNNGGFDAYLRYTESDIIAYAPTALEKIGALRCKSIVDRALRLVEHLPPTRDGREEALDALDADDALEALDEEFFTYPDDLTALLFAFVAKLPNTFGPLSE